MRLIVVGVFDEGCVPGIVPLILITAFCNALYIDPG
jgi:hypothetical protein